jgi:2-phosphosulfolactate phosphatase
VSEITRASLSDCANCDGIAVVIDVLRAFSTAAYAFAAGAREIYLVATVEEALSLHGVLPHARTMGEVRGRKIPQFHFGNSPAEFLDIKLEGSTLIQRTSAGTQGVVRSTNATHIFCASFVCAAALAAHLRRLAPPKICLVATGVEEELGGDADIACADYLELLLQGKSAVPTPFLERACTSAWAKRFGTEPELPSLQDLDLCLLLDRFNFVMEVKTDAGHFILRKALP